LCSFVYICVECKKMSASPKGYLASE